MDKNYKDGFFWRQKFTDRHFKKIELFFQVPES